MKEYFKGKKVLVTGGTGSIGSEIVRQVIRLEPEVVRIYSNDEDAQFRAAQEFGTKGVVRLLFGDVRDLERLKTAMEEIDIVFHAAALKHVPACEFDPFEAVKTNVIGTQNVAKAAMEQNVEKVINISTDKAVNPINVMGATKLLAERLTATANNFKGLKRTIFASVRFGNVLASRGSVIPIFLDQIRKGGPLTITDPKMTRFVMSISQSVALILKSAVQAVGGEIFILNMPALRIGDLADVMIDAYAQKFDFKPDEIKINVIGLRPGEKFHEELMTHMEVGNALKKDGMFVISSGLLDRDQQHKDVSDYNSSQAQLLSKPEIKKIVAELIDVKTVD